MTGVNRKTYIIYVVYETHLRASAKLKSIQTGCNLDWFAEGFLDYSRTCRIAALVATVVVGCHTHRRGEAHRKTAVAYRHLGVEAEACWEGVEVAYREEEEGPIES